MYKAKLWSMLYDRGIGNAQIEAAMKVAGVDKQIQDAKTQVYLNAFKKAQQGKNVDEADLQIALLAAENQPVANALAHFNPHKKDYWVHDNSVAKAFDNYMYNLGLEKTKADNKVALENQKQQNRIDLQNKRTADQIAVRSMFPSRAGTGGDSGDSSSRRSRSDSSEVKGAARGWVNKLTSMGAYAYQSIANGRAFDEENDDHNVENYRQALIDFKQSKDADDDDIDWADKELARLQSTYEREMNRRNN